MSFRSYRRHAAALPIASGWKSLYFGDSISDKWNAVSGVTQGKYRDAIDAVFGLTRLGEGAGANDWARGGISGRMISSATGQTLAGELTYVQCCLAKLPDIIFLELGTNDWFFATNALTPTALGTSIDNLMTGLTANVAVKSVQTLWPTAATTGGSYTLAYAVSTTPLLAHNATIATIQAALNTPATGGAIPFTASTQANDPPLSNNAPLILTANSAGANAQVVLGSNTVTGGTIQMDVTGLGGTPAVKMVVWVGHADHSAATTMNGAVPSWATSAGNAWQQMDGVIQAKVRQWDRKVNGIPVVYADMRRIPQTLLIDTTHPTDPGGTNFYVDRILKAVGMAG